MAEVYERLLEINKQCDNGKYNILKGLRLMNEAIQGSDLLPGEVSMHTLETLAIAMYKNKRSFQEEIDALNVDAVLQNNSTLIAQEQLTFVAPKGSSVMDAGHIFSNLIELKQPHAQAPPTNEPVFIEVLTATERLANQLIIDESVTIDGKIIRRPSCCKGRPGDGYVGCILYQIDELIAGSLGIYLSKREIDLFRQTGSIPSNSDSRVCILCYSQMLTCRAALFGTQGVGRSSARDIEQTMFYQDLVNCNNGYQSKFMILPGSDALYPPAPFLSFHPRHLRISIRGSNLYVDESAMWFRPEQKGFQ